MTGVHTGPHTIRIVNTSNDPNRPILDINSVGIVNSHQLRPPADMRRAGQDCLPEPALRGTRDRAHRSGLHLEGGIMDGRPHLAVRRSVPSSRLETQQLTVRPGPQLYKRQLRSDGAQIPSASSGFLSLHFPEANIAPPLSGYAAPVATFPVRCSPILLMLMLPFARRFGDRAVRADHRVERAAERVHRRAEVASALAEYGFRVAVGRAAGAVHGDGPQRGRPHTEGGEQPDRY